MSKIRTVEVHVEVADEAEAQAVLAETQGRPLAGFPDMRCVGGAIEHDHPVAVSHFQLDEHGEPKQDEAGKPMLNPLRDERGQAVKDNKGRLQFPPPRAAKIHVRLTYR